MISLFTRLTKLSQISNTQKVIRQKHKYPKEVRHRIDFSKVPKLDFEGTDKNYITESTVRGSGPGGQAVAKTSNAVQLTHTPTGIVVKVHETRSVDQNRKLAQQKLIDALDNFHNGDNSVERQAKRIQQEIKAQGKLEAKRNLDQKRLPKLLQKKTKLIDKITTIIENPQNYLDPEQKVEGLNFDLEKIKFEIQKEETRISTLEEAYNSNDKDNNN